jgi:hypothetical protein
MSKLSLKRVTWVAGILHEYKYIDCTYHYWNSEFYAETVDGRTFCLPDAIKGIRFYEDGEGEASVTPVMTSEMVKRSNALLDKMVEVGEINTKHWFEVELKDKNKDHWVYSRAYQDSIIIQ